MPGISSGLIKFTMSGEISGAQSWSTSLWLAITTGGAVLTQAQLDAVAAALNSDATAWWSSVRGYNNSTVDFRNLTLYYYQPGSLKADAISQVVNTPQAGSGTGSPLPPFSSLVTSLRSSTPGRSGRGRSYMPLTNTALNAANLQGPTVLADGVSSAYQTMINTINSTVISGSPITKFSVVVASFTKGATYPVANAVTDTKVDTQHRREDKLAPAYAKVRAITL